MLHRPDGYKLLFVTTVWQYAYVGSVGLIGVLVSC